MSLSELELYLSLHRDRALGWTFSVLDALFEIRYCLSWGWDLVFIVWDKYIVFLCCDWEFLLKFIYIYI